MKGRADLVAGVHRKWAHIRRQMAGYPTLALVVFCSGWLLAGCAPTAEANVVGYLIERQLRGNLERPLGRPSALTGVVLDEKGEPLPDATVLIAGRTGEPFVSRSNGSGRYRIDGVPPGSYVPAAVAPYYEETALSGAFHIPWLITLSPGSEVEAPPIRMQPHRPSVLPVPLPGAVSLEFLGSDIVTAPFPEGARAEERRYSFTRDGVTIDSLRLYAPIEGADRPEALLYAVYPTNVSGWQPVSVALASRGYWVLAISPAAAWGVDIDAHTYDARIGLALARRGHLGEDLADLPAVALGGSFSSAVLHRLLRDEGDDFEAWVTLGGITNAFSGSAAFYAGELLIPEQFSLVIPALGAANINPLPFLRYSPVYTAAQLPPTLVIHTFVDDIIPIDQARQLESALRREGVPVEVFYYEDVSHYLQIGENMTETGESMFWLVVSFIERYTIRD